MIKRRNFLKLLPVGLLAAKFGGLIDLIPVQKTIKEPVDYLRNIGALYRFDRIPGEIDDDFRIRLLNFVRRDV